MIKVGNIGKIVGGAMNNWFIIVRDDTKNTGGYLLIQPPNANFSESGYNNWFENLNELEQYIKYNNLLIKWLE